MTMHKSLKLKDTMRRHRNVLSRAEQIAILEDEGKWQEGDSVFGLPKVRQFVMKRRTAKSEKAAEEEAEAEAAEGEEAAGEEEEAG